MTAASDRAESWDAVLINSPVAISVDVLVLLTSGTVGDEANHPPGKNRDIADSVLLRGADSTGSSGTFRASDVVKCGSEGLSKIHQHVGKEHFVRWTHFLATSWASELTIAGKTSF